MTKKKNKKNDLEVCADILSEYSDPHSALSELSEILFNRGDMKNKTWTVPLDEKYKFNKFIKEIYRKYRCPICFKKSFCTTGINGTLMCQECFNEAHTAGNSILFTLGNATISPEVSNALENRIYPDIRAEFISDREKRWERTNKNIKEIQREELSTIDEDADEYIEYIREALYKKDDNS